MTLKSAYEFLSKYVDKYGVKTHNGKKAEHVGYINYRIGLDVMYSDDFGIEIDFSYPTSQYPSVKPSYTLKKGSLKEVEDLVDFLR